MAKFERQGGLIGVLCALLFSTGSLCAQVDSNPDPLAGLASVTLDDCVRAALENGPAGKTAQLALESAFSALVQARAKQGLTVGETVGYSHVGTSSSSPVALSSASGAASAGNSAVLGENVKGGLSVSGPGSSLGFSTAQSVPPNATDRVTSFGLTGSQVLWDGLPGGIPDATVKMAQSTFEVAKITQAAAVKTAVFQTQQAYYTLLGDQKTLFVRQATVQTAQSNLLQEQRLSQAGRATDLDVLQVKVALRQAQLDWTKALNQVTTDRKTLSITVGWPLERLYQVSDEPLPSTGADSVAEGVRMALSQRSDLRILEENLASSLVNLQIQKAGSSPVVTLNGSLGVGQDWTSSTSTQNFSVGADLALPPVWDGGLNQAQVGQASTQRASFELQRDQTRQNVAVTVEKDWFAVQDAKDRLDLAQTSVDAAQGQYDLEKAKLSLGLETTPNVLTAFTNLITAQVGLETAKSTLILAILQLNNDLGL